MVYLDCSLYVSHIGVLHLQYFFFLCQDGLSVVKENWNYLFVGHWMNGEFGHDRKNVSFLVKAFLETFKNKNKTKFLGGFTIGILHRPHN